jgi:hypothetical protein
MDIAAVLIELYGRIPPLAASATSGLDTDQLTTAPEPGANTVAWLVWHLARVQDHHLAEILGVDQIWAGAGWAERFGLEPDPSNTGYGHGPKDVAQVRPESPDALLDYLAGVARRTEDMLGGLRETDLDRIVDRRWNPPVTLGVRLVSVADDCLQHAGQAAYVRGLLEGREGRAS